MPVHDAALRAWEHLGEIHHPARFQARVLEHAFAQLGHWRHLSRCFEQTKESATA